MENFLFLAVIAVSRNRNRPQQVAEQDADPETRRRVPRIFRLRIGLEALSDQEVKRRFRLNRQSLINLYHLVEADIDPKTGRTHALPGMIKLLAVIHFLATGSFQSVSSIVVGLSQPSFSRHLTHVLKAILKHLKLFIHFPNNAEGWQSLKTNFFKVAGMPNVLGAIDCTHIQLRPPQHKEEQFRNWKHNHSLNVQMVSDAKLKIMSVRSNFPGSCHDYYILQQSALYRMFESAEMPDGWLLGDSGYPCRHWLMTPFTNPRTDAQKKYNDAHRSTRSAIERTYGLLKTRFRCLDRSGGVLQYDPCKVSDIILVCCILHNIALQDGDVDVTVLSNNENNEDLDASRDSTAGGVEVRNSLVARYFSC